MTVGHRHRVVVGAVPHQGQGTDPARPLLAGVVGYWRQGQQGLQVPLHPMADALRVAPKPSVHPLQAPALQVGIQRLEALEGRRRRQEVAPHVADHPLDLPLVVALAGTAEPVVEEVWDWSSVKARVRLRRPSPRILATASFVLWSKLVMSDLSGRAALDRVCSPRLFDFPARLGIPGCSGVQAQNPRTSGVV